MVFPQPVPPYFHCKLLTCQAVPSVLLFPVVIEYVERRIPLYRSLYVMAWNTENGPRFPALAAGASGNELGTEWEHMLILPPDTATPVEIPAVLDSAPIQERVSSARRGSCLIGSTAREASVGTFREPH